MAALLGLSVCLSVCLQQLYANRSVLFASKFRDLAANEALAARAMLALLGVGALLLVPGSQHRPAPRRRCRACVAAEPVPLPTSPKDVATQMSYAVQARTCPAHLRRSYVLLSYHFSYVLDYFLSYVVSHASAQPMDAATPCRQRSHPSPSP